MGYDVQAAWLARHLTGLPYQPALTASNGNVRDRAHWLRARTGGDDIPRYAGQLRGRRDEMLGRRRMGARRRFLLQARPIRLAAATRRAARRQNPFRRGAHFSVDWRLDAGRARIG